MPCSCSEHARYYALQHRLDDAEAAMRQTRELYSHHWDGGELDPIRSYFATYGRGEPDAQAAVLPPADIPPSSSGNNPEPGHSSNNNTEGF